MSMVLANASIGRLDQALSRSLGEGRCEFRWLVSSAETGARRGAMATIRVPANGRYLIHRYHGCERAIVVLEGSGEHLGAGGNAPMEALDAIFVPGDAWHGFANTGEDDALLLAAYGGHPYPPRLPCEVAVRPRSGALDPSPQSLPDLPAQTLAESEGFWGMESALFVAADVNGAKSMLGGFTRFDPGGTHKLHRHAKAEEALYLLEGGDCWQLSPGAQRPIDPAQFVAVASEEWHGFLNRGLSQAKALFFYFGAAAIGEDGYELFGG
jgi:quercetin dioxygenase-like cupin family protein